VRVVAGQARRSLRPSLKIARRARSPLEKRVARSLPACCVARGAASAPPTSARASAIARAAPTAGSVVATPRSGTAEPPTFTIRPSRATLANSTLS